MNIIAESIAKIAKRDGGRVTPKALVDAAKAKDHPMHDLFEWDDRKAGAKYREEQARGFISSVRVQVVYNERTLNAVAYVRDPSMPTEKQGYIETARLRTDEDRAHDAIATEFSRAASALDRAILIAKSLDYSTEEIEAIVIKVRGFEVRAMN